jgi:anti-sigma regulatory factor (Ser/Thr protein kinase)
MSESVTPSAASTPAQGSGSEDAHPAEGQEAGVRVPDRLDSIPAARAFLTRLLDGWGIADEVIDDACLLASELMSNAVKHGGGAVDLQIEAEDGRLRVGVHDDAGGTPVVTEAGSSSTGGRGMWIVQSVAHDWGTDPDASGKTVWFDLSLRQPAT